MKSGVRLNRKSGKSLTFLSPGKKAWHTLQNFYTTGVVAFLRFIGILNAAVWFGSICFFTFFVGPAFFSDQVLAVLNNSRPHAGGIAQVVLGKYFLLQQWCAGIALAQLIGEWLYTGRPFQRISLFLLMILFAIILLGGFAVQPRMKELHLKMYSPQTTQTVKAASKRSFNILHGASQVMNILVMGGVLVYLWQVTSTANSTRFTSVNRFRT